MPPCHFLFGGCLSRWVMSPAPFRRRGTFSRVSPLGTVLNIILELSRPEPGNKKKRIYLDAKKN